MVPPPSMRDPTRPVSPTTQSPSPVSAADLERKIAGVGETLGRALRAVLEVLPPEAETVQGLANTLGLDKVFASRLLKATRARDPLAVIYHAPGPEPLRRFARAARRVEGVEKSMAKGVEQGVAHFESLIRDDFRDRSALQATLSSWLPDARAEFQLRRKQSAFKAMSELLGVSAQRNVATALYHPSPDGKNIDVVWIMGLIGLQRVRPDAAVRLATRRMAAGAGSPRRPRTLDGDLVDDLEGLRLDAFCDAPPARLEVVRAGECTHYVLAGEDFGPRSAVDFLMAESNPAEIPRQVPKRSGRKGYLFAEVTPPVRALQFDVLLHRDIYPGASPSLRIYDTVLDGVADVNDPGRDLDVLDLDERVQALGAGLDGLRIPDFARYAELVGYAMGRLGWSLDEFRGWRCAVDYPVYGSQVAMVFDPPEDE